MPRATYPAYSTQQKAVSGAANMIGTTSNHKVSIKRLVDEYALIKQVKSLLDTRESVLKKHLSARSKADVIRGHHHKIIPTNSERVMLDSKAVKAFLEQQGLQKKYEKSVEVLTFKVEPLKNGEPI